MTLTQLRYLVAIADSNFNITQAAERVHATQPGPVSYTHLDVYKRQVDDLYAGRRHPFQAAALAQK